MKIQLSLIVASIFLSAFSDEVTVSSRFDEATGKWIGNVDELTNALHTAVAGRVIYLEKGELRHLLSF